MPAKWKDTVRNISVDRVFPKGAAEGTCVGRLTCLYELGSAERVYFATSRARIASLKVLISKGCRSNRQVLFST